MVSNYWVLSGGGEAGDGGGGWGEEGPCVEILQRLKPKPASAAKLALTCHLPGIHPTSWKVDHLQDGPRAKGSRRGRVSGTDR